MNDIKRIADLMYQCVIQRNLDILKAGLVVIATDQQEMIKSTFFLTPSSITYGEDQITAEVKKVVEEYDFRIYYLDSVLAIVDEAGRVRAAIITTEQNYFPASIQYPFYQQPASSLQDPVSHPIYNIPPNKVEVIGLSDVNMLGAGGDIFSLYSSLCEIYKQNIFTPASNTHTVHKHSGSVIKADPSHDVSWGYEGKK